MTRDIDIAIMSVCLSVYHVPVFYQNGLTYCHGSYHAEAKPLLFYQHQTFSQNSDGVTHCGALKASGV